MISAPHAVGIDIGGTKIAVALVNSQGTIVHRLVLPTEAEKGFNRAVERVAQAVEQLLPHAKGRGIEGIGIGCAGPIDPAAGTINNPYTLTGWNGCDIVGPLQRRFHVPVFLENDADAAAFGEFTFGAGKGFDPVVLLTFGTGVGGGAVVHGRIYRGVNGEHPELGHIPVNPTGFRCYCGIAGCLEAQASGTALTAVGVAAGFPDTRSLFRSAREGNIAAQEIVSKAAEAAALGAWTICHTLLPQRLILGGGIMEDHFDLFVSPIRTLLQQATQFTTSAVSIAQAVLGNDAGIVGAASLALEGCNGPKA